MDGPYNFGPFVMDTDSARTVLVDGNKCVIEVDCKVVPSWLCGYVAVPRAKVPAEWIAEFENIPVDVHGGVTYLQVFGEYVVIGFDCAHVWDEGDPKVHDPEFVMSLVNDMAGQLAALGVL